MLIVVLVFRLNQTAPVASPSSATLPTGMELAMYKDKIQYAPLVMDVLIGKLTLFIIQWRCFILTSASQVRIVTPGCCPLSVLPLGEWKGAGDLNHPDTPAPMDRAGARRTLCSFRSRQLLQEMYNPRRWQYLRQCEGPHRLHVGSLSTTAL